MKSLWLAIAVLATVGAACSSSGTSPPASSPRTSDASSGSSTPVPAAESAAITHAYQAFFSGHTTPAAAAKVLQHGSSFLPGLTAQAKSQQAGSLSAKITSVTRDPAHPSPDVAKVTFSLVSNGSALLPGASGYAVRTDGHWQVAARTYCALVALEGAAPKPCKDSSVVALPHS